ncbi:hypothetical protein Alg130_12336, partial [Pyrenophora tritici-repentis]
LIRLGQNVQAERAERAGSLVDKYDEEREELDEEMMDDIDESIEVAEEEPGQGEGPEPKKLSKIQKACLEFCIALLNHRITRREYDSPLVCALAVLGVKEDGWKGPE